MNATMMMVLVAATGVVGQEPQTLFKAPRIEVKVDTNNGKDFSYLLYNRVYLGRQFHKSATEPDLHRLPTTYFHDQSPIGVVLKKADWFPPKDAPPVAVLGMDIGTLAAYAHPGQTFHFTERVPVFVKLSLPDKGEKRYFTYVQDALDRGAKVKVFEGEPRAMLEKHGADGSYKIIIVETYKLPVIEVHKELLTKEALQMMMSKLRKDGIIAFHTSNRYYQLAPVIASAANELKLAVVVGKDEGGSYADPKTEFRYSSEWVFVARDEKVLNHLKKHETKLLRWSAPELRGKVALDKIDKEFLWTDKGEQSFRGLYYSDPDIDRYHDMISDVHSFFTNDVGVPFRYVDKVASPLRGLVRAWSEASAYRMNRDSPAAPKKKTPEIK